MAERVDEATSPATAEDLRDAADWIHHRAESLRDVNLVKRLRAAAAIRDSERATREAERAVIDAVMAWHDIDLLTETGASMCDEGYYHAESEDKAIDAVMDAAAALALSRLPTSPEPGETT